MCTSEFPRYARILNIFLDGIFMPAISTGHTGHLLRRVSALWRRVVNPLAFEKFMEERWIRDFREALLFCLPGVAVGTVLRLWLLFYMPAAFVHTDTSQILVTPEHLLASGHFDINPKKTFLTPLVYSIPALLHIPILYFSSVVQHLFGVLLIVLVGLLSYAWFSWWRLLIIPLTIVTAINPVLLWYEHTAVPESLAVFGAVAVALTGTLYWKQPNRYTLALLFLALLIVAGARPEGRLFSLFAIALVARRLWGDWPRFRIGVGLTSVFAFVIFVITRTGQSGILLYASLIQWSPDHLLSAPGLAERMRPIQEEAIVMWEQKSRPKHVRLRREMAPAIAQFLQEQGVHGNAYKSQVNAISKRAGIEIAVRNFWRLPGFALEKFVIGHFELPARDFSDYPLSGQWMVLKDKDWQKNLEKHSRVLWGATFSSPDEARTFLASRYDVFAGIILTPFLHSFVNAQLYPIVPIELPGSDVLGVQLKGLPWLYTCAVLGALCLVLRERPAFGFQFLLILFLVALFIVLMVTANIRARFRMPFEAFWYLYAFALLDSALALMQKVRGRFVQRGERHIAATR